MKNVYSNFMISFVLVGGVLSSPAARSINEMTDGQLSAITGQDGVTITVTPALVGGVTTLPISNITYADTDGIPSAILSGYGNATSLRTDLKAIQLFGASMATGSYSIKAVFDFSGGGAANASAGLNPVLSGTLTMPNVRTISATLNTRSNGAGSLIGVTPLGANAAGALDVNATSILPILSVGTYTYGGDTVFPTAQVLASTPRLNINLNRDLEISLKLGQPSADSMITFTSLDIASINFDGQALNLESGNEGTDDCDLFVCSSRLSVTPSLTGLDLSGSTLDVLTAENLNTALGLTSGTVTSGGLLFQDSAASLAGVAFNNVTAGTPGNANSGFGGMRNAPIGSFGASNIAISNLKIGISGL